jgi:hypothetical protein
VFAVLVHNAFPQPWSGQAVVGLFWIAGATTLASSIQYAVDYTRRMQEQPSEPAARKP